MSTAVLFLVAFRILASALLLLQAGQVQLPPAPRGFGTDAAEIVVDAANVLTPDAIERINRIAFDVHKKSGGEIAFVTLADIGQRDPVDIGVQIGRTWGVGSNAEIGDSARNAGVVILLVPKETSTTGRGRCRVVTGRGSEGFITDADAGDICREAVPLLSQRDYANAGVLITQRVAARYAKEFNFAIDSTLRPPPEVEYRQPSRRGGGFSIPPQLLFIAFIFILMLLSSGRRRGGGCGGCFPIFFPFGGGGWGGGGFSGGSWGGGGGGFGGGGFGGFGGGGGFSGGGGGSDW